MIVSTGTEDTDNFDPNSKNLPIFSNQVPLLPSSKDIAIEKAPKIIKMHQFYGNTVKKLPKCYVCVKEEFESNLSNC